MHRKIFKTGNSLVVALSKSLLDKAGLKVGDSVEMEVAAEKIVITKSKKGSQQILELKIRRKL
jgi:antitoxin component of MazEF toxin-antitoxin module